MDECDDEQGDVEGAKGAERPAVLVGQLSRQVEQRVTEERRVG